MGSPKRILSVGTSGHNVLSLQNNLKLLGYYISKREIKDNLYGNSTEKAIKRFQSENNLNETGVADELTINNLYEFAKEQGFFSVKGTIVTASRVAAKGLVVKAMDKNQGNNSLLGKTITDDSGNYVILYKKGKQNPDIELKIVDLEDEAKIYGISSVHFNAENTKIINLVLNDVDKIQDKRTEFSQIFSDLSKHVENASLSDLDENKDRQDISYLSGKTGLDARLIAMISLSDKYSHDSQIRPDFYYALFRSGISTNPDDLYKTNSEAVRKIWTKGIKDRIIDQSLEQEIDTNLQLYKEKQQSYLLENMKPSRVSSLKDLISLSIPEDEKKQKQFIDLYFNNSGNLEEFWTKVEKQFGTSTMKKLQLDSKLGYLTMNNANLIKKLQSSFTINDPADLIKEGLYKKEKWHDLFDGNELPMPQWIGGEDEQAKKESYINHMTLHLKKSYPTLVVSDMIKTDELKINDSTVRDEVCDSLNNLYEKLGFRLGTQPIEKVLKDNPDTIIIGDKGLKELKKIQRIYQLAPSDDTMKVLWTNNLNSALSIVQYNKGEFIDTFGESLGGPEIASTIYSKAHQVHSTVLNLATAYMTYKVNPRVYALSQMIPEDTNPPIIENPALEELFGSLDYCQCDHCQSVLSPSSYLVDLLQFINLKKYDSDGNETEHTYLIENPLDVLLSKRPDLEHIQLTCENTNTSLPYIDLVNEILEYYVVNHSIAGFEGFNTQDITTIELLANPQFVNEQAYTILKGQVYPPNLPFNRSLEYLRLLYNNLKIELNEAMEKLRVNENNLDVATTNPEPYAWREIYNEFLGISPEEFKILTNSADKKLSVYFGEDQNMTYDEFKNKLSNAKTFAQKTDITYVELIELVSTKFINPDSYLIPKLQKLAVTFADIQGFIDGTITESDFDKKIPIDIKEKEQETPQYGGNILQWVRDNHEKIMNLIVLSFPVGEQINCTFDKLELRYSLPNNNSNYLKEIDFWCLLRFIRLWKKLGWTIEETDKVITALYKKELLPKNSTTDINIQKQNLDKGIKDLLIKVSHVKKVMIRTNLNSKLIELLSVWSDIDVQGKNSLYNKTLLNTSIPKIDNVFDENASGEYLQDPNKKIGGYIDVLQAAFNLGIKDISQIMEDAGLTNESQLILGNVSTFYRYSFLARCLGLDIEELVMIKQMSGVDPFIELKDVNPNILTFIDIVKMIRDSKFKTDTLNYYLLHKDITGKASPSGDALLQLAKAFKDGLNRIEQENTVGNNPDGEVIKSRMSLVYENAAADRFFGLLKGVTQYSIEYDHQQDNLEPEIRNTTDKIGYDHFSKRLIFHGVMTETILQKLTNLSIVSAEFKTAIKSLYDMGRADFADFFDAFPELEILYDKYLSSTGQDENERMKAILEAVMPTLKKNLKQLFVKQTLCSALNLDLLMINGLLDNHDILHSLQKVDQPLIEDILGLEAGGTSLQYFFSDADDIPTSAQPDIEEPFSGNIDYNSLPKNPNNPGDRISAVWKFFVEAPISENYNFYMQTDPDAKVRISINDEEIDVKPDSNGVWSNDKNEPIILQSGKLYKIRLQITKVKDKAILKWASKGTGKVVIPIKYLYSYEQIQIFDNSYIRLLKAIGIIERLNFREKEISFFSTDTRYQIEKSGLLNSIPVSQNPPQDKTINLFNKLIVLLRYVSLKKSLKIDDEILTTIFEEPDAVDENGEKIILKATGWNDSFLSSILNRFGWKQADVDLSRLLRINEAFEIVKKFGAHVDSLLHWTTNSPSDTTILDVKNTLRSKYDDSIWLNALQPMNDQMRSNQRNALVSYILHEMQKKDDTKKINTPDKLFEYFLIDVQMDPCMKTSRIKQAISTTQLFIQRCLMNLEPRVASSDIKKDQWEWMQRYRVSEANKKLFLYPENWLVSELRDVKSSFFKELEGELLQADMNEELAETAMLNYLQKLDEVSKLEICAMYLKENEAGNKFEDVLHVFGRTSRGASRKYYYRRFELGYWTGWEKINADIEDNPILPVVWKNRLFLFWLNVIRKGSDAHPLPAGVDAVSLKTDDLNAAAAAKASYDVNLCWSEYYNNKWQPTETSDFKYPIVGPGYDTLDRDKLEIYPTFHDDGSLEIKAHAPENSYSPSLSGPSRNFDVKGEYPDSFILNDTRSVKLDPKSAITSVQFFLPLRKLNSRSLTVSGDPLPVDYQINVEQGRSDKLLGTTNTYEIVSNANYCPVTNIVEVPFFYQDKKHVFLVKPEVHLTTVSNYPHIFTDTGILSHDTTMEEIKIPPIWEKPEIVKREARLNNRSMIPSTIVASGLATSKPTDLSNKVNPLNKIILDYNPVSYGDVAIGPLGSKHGCFLRSNRIDTDDQFEIISNEWARQ